MAGDVRRSGGQWRATGGAPTDGSTPLGVAHLPQTARVCSRRRSAVTTVIPAPRRARPMWVRHVWPVADVAMHDVAAERVSGVPDVCISLKQFSK
jgi:hypothetical protein